MKLIIRKALKIQLVMHELKSGRIYKTETLWDARWLKSKKRAIPGVGEANVVHSSSVHQLHPFLPAWAECEIKCT